jgi:hypothetical protein
MVIRQRTCRGSSSRGARTNDGDDDDDDDDSSSSAGSRVELAVVDL